MRLHTPIPSLLSILLTLLYTTPSNAQNAAAGGGAPAVANPLQYPTVTIAPSLTTAAGGATSAINLPFTQTFVLPLGTWAFPTPSSGSVGLGNIQGAVGKVKTAT